MIIVLIWLSTAFSALFTARESQASTLSPRRLVEVVDLANPVISPDGRRVAFRAEYPSIERDTYDTVWYVQEVDGESPPRRVAEGGVPLREYATGAVLASPAAWSPDGRWIFYRAYLDGQIAIWRAAADGSDARRVTSDPADVRDFALSDDGRILMYSVGATRDEVLAAEQGEYDQGVRIDDTSVVAAGLVRSSQVEGRPSTQRFIDGWYATGPMLAEFPDRWKAVNLATLVTGELPSSDVPPVALAAGDLRIEPEPWKLVLNRRDGRVALLTRVGSEDGVLDKPDVELAVLNSLHSRQPFKCLAALCTGKAISDLRWRPGTDEVLFTAFDYRKGRAQAIYGWNVSTGDVRPVVVSDGLVSGGQRYWEVPCGLSSEYLVCVAAEADRPPRLESIDLTTGDRRVLFEPNRRLEADIAATAPATFLRWKDARGREFTGHLFRSPRTNASVPPPLFVNFYSCEGFLRGGLGDEWPLASLAEHGISALCANVLPEYRTDFVERYDQGRLAVEGVVAHLAASGEVDPTRVGMGALSYGSDATMWTAVNSNVLNAASISSPSVNEVYYLYNSLRSSFRAGLRDMWELGAPEETRERWQVISPAHHLDSIRIPILFQMPEQEFRLALEYVLPMVRGHRADLYVFPDEAHVKYRPKHKIAAYERNLDWFRFWLQDEEDADPAKARQYDIWRQMREAMEKPRSGVEG